jgi:Calcineurin-like phosphoesterase
MYTLRIALPFIGILVVYIIVSVESVLGFADPNSSFQYEAERKLPDFSIAAVGDMGCNPVVKKIISDINNKKPMLMLALGDLSYQKSNADCWFAIVSPIYSKMKVGLGEHDYKSSIVLKQYRNEFNLSKDYYSFNYRNVHFITLATEIPFDKNSSQYSFVKKDLEGISKNPDIKWIIVSSYRPQYSSPTVHPGNGDLRHIYHPLFQKYRVDLILQAHNHNYQRTYPINYDELTPSDPMITDFHIKNYQNPAGQMYSTIGTGGAQLHQLDGKAPYVAAQYEGFGFLLVSLTNNGRNMTGTFYSEDDGSTKDSFTLTK